MANIFTNPGPANDYFVYDMTPRYEGGFTSNFNFRDWSLSVFFHFTKQRGLSATTSAGFPGSMNNQPSIILDHWRKPGDITDVGRLTTFATTNGYNYYYYSDASLCDASYIRLQNLSLAYELPEKWRKKAGVGNFKIYVQCENLFLITNYEGIDPETQNFGGLPRPRVLTAGLSCNL